MTYVHTQKVPDELIAAAGVACLALGLTPAGIALRLLVCGTLGAAAATFRSMTVTVGTSEISVSFGDGLIKKSFSLLDLESVHLIRTSPLSGWGIHWAGTGWLYNVYGLDAVELRFFGGKRVMIGTDDKENLLAALNDRLFRMSITERKNNDG